jgi:hypothetical protein
MCCSIQVLRNQLARQNEYYPFHPLADPAPFEGSGVPDSQEDDALLRGQFIPSIICIVHDDCFNFTILKTLKK